MRVKIISIVTIVSFLVVGLFGCASIVPEEHKGAATGAAVGGATEYWQEQQWETRKVP
jgi:uncharacterized protein YceK